MKIKIISSAFLIMLFLFSGSVNAQDANKQYGKDSLKCLENISLFGEYSKQKAYEDAIGPWRYCFVECPSVHKALYAQGASMLKYFIKKNKSDKEISGAYVDTLMLLYDQRIEYFGTGAKYGKGYVLGRKGIDLLKYRKNLVEEAYGYLKESVQTQGKYIDHVVSVTFIQASRRMLKLEKITDNDMVDNFILTVEQLEKAIAFEKKEKKKAKLKTAISNCETITTETKVLTCEKLIEIYTPRYNAEKENLGLLKKISKFLTKNKCTDSKLFADVAESWFPLEPSSESAAALAQVFAKREDLDKAKEYYQKAVDLEKDSVLKGKFFYKLALISKVQKKPSESRKYARESIKLRPNWGDPYILIATLYVGSANSCGVNPDGAIKDIERRGAYWAAVDKLVKARSVDSSVSKEVGSLISQYSAKFPNSEKAFMAGFKAGQKHKVGSWIQETTTVRFKK